MRNLIKVWECVYELKTEVRISAMILCLLDLPHGKTVTQTSLHSYKSRLSIMMQIWINLPVCCLLIVTFANSLKSDQPRHLDFDLDPNCSTQKRFFLKKS